MNNLALYVVTVAVWGTTWIAIEFQLGVVAPEVSVFYRYVLASLLLFAWCRLRRLPLRFDARAHKHFALLGLLLFCLNYVMTYYAQQYITSAMSAIAFSTMLWMNILNARIFFGVRAGIRVLAGAVLGVAGIGDLRKLGRVGVRFFGGLARWSRGSAGKRAVAALVSAVAVTTLSWAWWPHPGNYRPIGPDERSLVASLMPGAPAGTAELARPVAAVPDSADGPPAGCAGSIRPS